MISFYCCKLLVFFDIIEWYWKCVLYGYTQKVLAVLAGILSAAVVWSEVTFFNREPVLSIFAVIVNVAKNNYDYFKIEVMFCLVFNCICKYFLILAIFYCHYFIFMLLCLLYSFKNTSFKFVLFGAASSN